jgi:hypothetical protein
MGGKRTIEYTAIFSTDGTINILRTRDVGGEIPFGHPTAVTTDGTTNIPRTTSYSPTK